MPEEPPNWWVRHLLEKMGVIEERVDRLESEADRRAGAREAGESWRLRWGVVAGVLLVILAILGAVATIAQLA